MQRLQLLCPLRAAQGLVVTERWRWGSEAATARERRAGRSQLPCVSVHGLCFLFCNMGWGWGPRGLRCQPVSQPGCRQEARHAFLGHSERRTEDPHSKGARFHAAQPGCPMTSSVASMVAPPTHLCLPRSGSLWGANFISPSRPLSPAREIREHTGRKLEDKSSFVGLQNHRGW